MLPILTIPPHLLTIPPIPHHTTPSLTRPPHPQHQTTPSLTRPPHPSPCSDGVDCTLKGNTREAVCLVVMCVDHLTSNPFSHSIFHCCEQTSLEWAGMLSIKITHLGPLSLPFYSKPEVQAHRWNFPISIGINELEPTDGCKWGLKQVSNACVISGRTSVWFHCTLAEWSGQVI